MQGNKERVMLLLARNDAVVVVDKDGECRCLWRDDFDDDGGDDGDFDDEDDVDADGGDVARTMVLAVRRTILR